MEKLNLEKLKEYSTRPDIWGPHGVIYYISEKSCRIIVEEMKKINYNVLYYDELTESYPYTIEDVGISYILYKNGINFIDSQLFFGSKKSICYHTNKYK